MKVIFYLGLLWSSTSWVQSISLTEAVVTPVPTQTLSFVEFRDARLENVLKLMKMQGGMKIPKITNLSADLSLRLENVTWDELLKIILDQVTP